ncbi:hypothetical protein A5727_14760 [Mycobacterium sp. ACS4331]|nr:hypothetical protein A5727_14760 [Mycobacterium sp. ACS4331]
MLTVSVGTVDPMTPRHDFKLTHPGSLIAAIPAVLGFVPERSLVIVGIDGGEMGAVLRMDLSDALAGGVGHLVDVAASSGADAAIACIVDDAGSDCTSCGQEYAGLCAALADRLEAVDMTLIDAHIVDRIAAGGRWHCADGCGAGGVVDDPSASPLSMAAVLDGRRLYASRDELESIIATDLSRDSAGIARAVQERADGPRLGDQDIRNVQRKAVRGIISAARRVGRGKRLSDQEVAGLAYDLTDLTVRDAAYALAVGSAAGAAEQLWVYLARVLPPPWRAEALTFVGFFAYARGDGPLAGVALSAALEVDPTHRMAGMLDSALQAGMRPEKIRGLATTGAVLARDLGITLPGDAGAGVRPSRPSRRAPSRAAGRRSRGRG